MELSAEKWFENLQKQYEQRLPFVIFKHPHSEVLKAFLQQDTTLHTRQHFSEAGFILAPFDYQDFVYCIPKTIFFTANCSPQEPFPKKKILELNSNPKIHENLVKKALQFIEKNEAKKIVLAHKFSFSNIKINPFLSFENLLNKYSDHFCYLFFHPKLGLWMGATPEIFCKMNNHHFKTVSLAGTILKGNAKKTFSKKEKDEQNWVTKGIVNQLNNLCETLEIQPLKTISQGNLSHLCNELKGVLKKNCNLKNYIEKLHPTPAVCGFPKAASKNFILENEDFDRRFYTGFLGEILGEKQSKIYANIRCFSYENQNLSLYVGGGITKDSIPKKEWEELCNKCNIILDILA